MATNWADEIASRVKTHLFVVPINNSGSSYLSRALATCRAVIYLKSEGQHVVGWGGAVPKQRNLSLIWGHSASGYEAVLADPANYDWPHIKRTWYAAARLHDPDAACVFLEKSPPHVARVHMLDENFHDARFIFLVRDPYAIIESIGRRRARVPRFAKVASEHVLTCLRLQKDNASRFPNSILLRYEDMCADPGGTQSKIKSLVPELDDFVLDQRIKIKGLYDENLRDMNEDHIARLPPGLIPRLNEHLARREDLLAHFGYSLR